MALARAISSDRDPAVWIREIHRFPNGAEALRIIVRDDLCGVGDTVANAIWEGLM